MFTTGETALNLDRPIDDASSTVVGLIGAVLAPHRRAVIRVDRDGRAIVLFKGVSAATAMALAPDERLTIADPKEGERWRDDYHLGPLAVAKPMEGSFSIRAADHNSQFVIDFVVHELWPLIVAAAFLAVAISYVVFGFLRRRYREVLKEQARFEDYAGSASDFFWEMDADLRFAYFSDRFTEVTGVPQSHLLGKTRLELGNPGAKEEDWRAHLDALYARRPFKEFVHPRTKPDGSVVWLSINGKPFFEDGKFAGFRGTGTDITVHRTVERQLILAKDEAQQANRAKTEFLAAMSHDLRTPLNAILGFSDVIRHQYFGPLDDKYTEYVENIHSSGELLLSLVEEVLDLSAIEAGKRTILREKLDLAAILKDCGRLLDPIARASNVRLVIDVREETIPFVADKTAIKQILHNLATNAIKFTAADGIVEIKGVAIGDNVAISVRDTGRGMSKEELRRATEPFEKGPAVSDNQDKGWGLGLSIVKRLVELMDGTLHIESTPGSGTLVTFSVPRGTFRTFNRIAS
ncbi:MAG: PAS domain-containing sensor histidine kinase [Rhodospirillales bacterium]